MLSIWWSLRQWFLLSLLLLRCTTSRPNGPLVATISNRSLTSTSSVDDGESAEGNGGVVCGGTCRRLNFWQLRVPATGSSTLVSILKAASAAEAHAPRGGPCDACARVPETAFLGTPMPETVTLANDDQCMTSSQGGRGETDNGSANCKWCVRPGNLNTMHYNMKMFPALKVDRHQQKKDSGADGQKQLHKAADLASRLVRRSREYESHNARRRLENEDDASLPANTSTFGDLKSRGIGGASRRLFNGGNAEHFRFWTDVRNGQQDLEYERQENERKRDRLQIEKEQAEERKRQEYLKTMGRLQALRQQKHQRTGPDENSGDGSKRKAAFPVASLVAITTIRHPVNWLNSMWKKHGKSGDAMWVDLECPEQQISGSGENEGCDFWALRYSGLPHEKASSPTIPVAQTDGLAEHGSVDHQTRRRSTEQAGKTPNARSPAPFRARKSGASHRWGMGRGKGLDMSFAMYARAAWWNWNVMVRTLAGNYTHDFIGGTWSNPIQDLTTRSEAWEMTRRDSKAGEQLLAVAIERLSAMPAFILTDRYDESVELLAHTFCWRLEALSYVPSSCKINRLKEKRECAAENITKGLACEAWQEGKRLEKAKARPESKIGHENEDTLEAYGQKAGPHCPASVYAMWRRQAASLKSKAMKFGGAQHQYLHRSHTTILWPTVTAGQGMNVRAKESQPTRRFAKTPSESNVPRSHGPRRLYSNASYQAAVKEQNILDDGGGKLRSRPFVSSAKLLTLEHTIAPELLQQTPSLLRTSSENVDTADATSLRRLSQPLNPAFRGSEGAEEAETAAQRERNWLHECLRLDLSLYAAAERIFDERIAAMRRDQANGMRCALRYDYYLEGEQRRRWKRQRQRRDKLLGSLPKEKREHLMKAHGILGEMGRPLTGLWSTATANDPPSEGSSTERCSLKCALPPITCAA